MRTRQSIRSRWLWGLLVAIMMTFGHSITASADTAQLEQSTNLKWYANSLSATQTYFALDLYLGENSGSYSCWLDDPSIYVVIDGTDNYLCKLSDLGIKGMLACGDADKWEDHMDDIRKTDNYYKVYSKTSGYGNFTEQRFSIGAWDPHINSNDEYWVALGFFLGNMQEGKTATIKVVGHWRNNADYNVCNNNNLKTLTVTTNAINTGTTWPTLGTIARSGKGKVTYTRNQNTATAPSNWSFGLHLYSNSEHTTLKSDATYGTNSSITLSDYDDYTAYTLYPIFYIQQEVKKSDSNASFDVPTRVWNNSYSTLKVPGYPRPKTPTLTPEQWSRSITISWTSEVQNSSNYSTDGKWTIWRKVSTADNSTAVKVGTVEYGTTSFTDTYSKSNALNYDTNYTYFVSFVPNAWGITATKYDELSTSLMSSGTSKITRDFKIGFGDVTGTGVEGLTSTITVNWVYSPSFGNASTTNPYHVNLYRYINNGNPECIKTYDITSSTVTTGTYTETNVTSACDTYHYYLEVEALGTTFTTDTKSGCIDGNSKVTSLNVSQGKYSGTVKLNWEVNQIGTSDTYFNIYRRNLGTTSDYSKIYTTHGTGSSYSYDDNTALPGTYYEYKVECYTDCSTAGGQNGQSVSEVTGDGFSLSSGVVSGRVTYGSGTAVGDVKVVMTPQDATKSQFYSMKIDGVGCGVVYNSTNANLANLFDQKDWTFQMYIRPEVDNSYVEYNGKDTTEYILADVQDSYSFYLLYNSTKKAFEIEEYMNGTRYRTGIYLPCGQFSHVTFSYSKDQQATDIYAMIGDSLVTAHFDKEFILSTKATCLSVGNDANFKRTKLVKGYLDEVRLWSGRALTADEVKENYSCTLTGSENNLALYWPMDEGVNAGKVYDFSKTNGVANGRYGTLMTNTTSSTTVPTTDQLSLCAYTDSLGDFVIRGIPFSGEGVNYTITPSKGTHEFNPISSSRFISANSLVHSEVNFTDETSFKVSGIVRYNGTTIPVSGAYLYVDGTVAARDGEAVTTDDNGKFSVDVPIGKHYIQVKMNGHEFVNEGRYPEGNPYETTYAVFESDRSGLTFWDKTLVTIAGRVAGGEEEEDKYLGLGLGTANIGKAVIKLQHAGTGIINAKKIVNGLSVNYDSNDEERTFDSATENIKSTAVVGLNNMGTSNNYITITTDPETGEWSALVPPLRYNATSIEIPSQPDIDFSTKLFSLDATNPLQESSDSLDETHIFRYVAAEKVIYRSDSHLDVTEGHLGVYGTDYITATNYDGTTQRIAAYTLTKDAKGNVTNIDYTFGYPVYEQKAPVSYDLFAYEEYVNNDDKDNPVSVKVPLAELDVNIQNQFASTTSVYINGNSKGEVQEMEDNTLTLDSLGRATYTFTVGLPNIGGDFTRTMNISYELNGTTYAWEGNSNFKAIILGALPKGNNFVTDGPDKVLMVLRDPPGTNSSTTWSKGSSVSHTDDYTFSRHSNTSEEVTLLLGAETGIASGVGVAVISDTKSKVNLEEGYEIDYSEDHGNSKTTTITATRDISTSDGADFVGACGDVFIGYATNTVLGACTNVQVVEDVNGDFVVTSKDALSMSEKFKTSFNYTQNYVENVLIPNFESTRNSLLPYIGDRSITSITRPKSAPAYYSKLSEDDENYGTSNCDSTVWGKNAKSWDRLTANDFKKGYIEGPSYYVVLPTDDNLNYSDTICYFNNQIKGWEFELAKNELAKIKCIKSIEKSWKKENFSFDAGASITITEEVDTTKTEVETKTYDHNFHLGGETGFSFNGFGFEVKLSEDAGMTYNDSDEDEKSKTTSFSYTLAEDGDDDYLSVDVYYPAPDNFGPIFYTRAGATCAPWEDQVVAKYAEEYEGTILQQKTLQIEKPELVIPNNIISGVPSGKSAKMKIELWNRSETGEDCYYGLWVNPESNSDGLQVFLDGQNIAAGIDLLIPAGDEPVEKTLELRQTDTDILEYKDVSLSMYSTSQPDDTGVFPGIYSDKSFSVFFQPSCTDIDMTASRTLVNTDNMDDVTFSMSGYDYNQATFKEIRLQYKGENDANFVTLKTFVKDSEATDSKQSTFSALSGTNKLTYKVDMSGNDFTDQTYIFRALAVGYRGAAEVTTPSDEISIVRDMSRPQLITMPTPTSGILVANDNITLTFNEDIRDNLLTSADNFTVTGEMNESEVSHNVGLSLTGSESTAKTESTIDLSNKSFSMDMWVKYTQDGRILQHGTSGAQFTASVVGGKLALTVGNSTVTSDATLPKDEWIYLMLSYDNSGENPVVNASYANTESSVALFRNQAIESYEGNGPVSLGGNNLKATVQELSVWNEARTMTESLADMYQTKNQYTSGLIGYWQMNEGHGLTAKDRSRSRNLTLTAQSAWYLNSGTNYELQLDGKTNVKANANLAALNSESYLIETWFKATEGENGVASILSMPGKLDIRLNSNGALELGINNEYTTTYTAANLYDNQWHHLALNVLKNTNGSAVLYLDGNATRQFSASAMPTLEGGFVLGALSTTDEENPTYSQHVKGAIDELRVWKGNRTAALINNYMYTRVKSTDDGLAAYYPMEQLGLDDYSQVVTTPILTSLAGQGIAIRDAAGSTLVPQTSQLALAQAPAQENVQFSYVASERQITISLDEQPYKIENCNINLTARHILDKNGNEALPISWTIYVQQNQLKWENSEIEAQVVSGEGTTFTVELQNNSATTDVWALNNLPSWLSVSSETGSLSPASSQKLKFTVDPSVAVGNYEETIYAVGSQNIETPLTISLKVIGQVPDWNPVPDVETMAVVGQLQMNGVFASDPDDMIAAFCEQKCVGVAHLAYSSRYDAYMISMNVYGNDEMSGKTLNYKVYDASTGTIYPAVSASNSEAYTFKASKLVGNYTSPVIFSPENKIEQDLSLNRSGWKWFSMYVTPETNDAKEIFKDATGKISIVKGRKGDYLAYVGGAWTSVAMSLDPALMYKLCATEAFTETSIGTPATPANTTITLASGWNWIGYPAQASNSLANAFADANPEEGDILMGQSSFAIYNGGQWDGSLTGVTPGDGYKYFSNASSTKTFKYQTPSNGSSRSKVSALDKPHNILELSCEDNMAMVAQVVKDGQIVQDAEVSVYASNELCGYSASSDSKDRHFITIGGLGQKTVDFIVRIGEDEYSLPALVTYENSKLYGTLNSPFLIDMDHATAIKGGMAGKAIRMINVYNTSGVLIRTTENPGYIFTPATIGNIPSGTYLQHITYMDGTTAVVKLMK